jgi:hypothetical protein
MANRYTRLAAMYFADSLHRTNYMHRFCHRPLAAHLQKHKMKALNVLIGDLRHCIKFCYRPPVRIEYGGLRFASQQIAASHVCFGSKADIEVSLSNVRFTPKSGHRNSVAGCPLCATGGLMHCSKRRQERLVYATFSGTRGPFKLIFSMSAALVRSKNRLPNSQNSRCR